MIPKFPTHRKGQKSYGAYKFDKRFLVFHLQFPFKESRIRKFIFSNLKFFKKNLIKQRAYIVAMVVDDTITLAHEQFYN